MLKIKPYLKCSRCHTLNKEDFPDKIIATTQYGDNLKSLVSYLNTYQMLPYAEIIKDLTSHKINTGTIYNFLNRHYDNLEKFEDELKCSLLKDAVLPNDETGINIKAKLHLISKKRRSCYGRLCVVTLF